MTATVMSSYYFNNPAASGWRPVANPVTNSGVNQQLNWMMAQTAQYPATPQTNQHQYNPMYQINGGTQQLLESHDGLQYSDLNHVMYPKVVESTSNGQSTSAQQVHDLSQQLQYHTGYEEQQLNPPLQPVPQATIHSQHPHTLQTSHPPAQDIQEPPQKVNRLRKACDSCSIRKVRCDESGPPCRACTALDIPCTFDRPSRRRGPPNRYAESIKRRRLEEPNDPSRMVKPSSPSSPTHAAHALAALSSRTVGQPPSAESICSVQTLDALIDDFFTYIHPLCPFPHEPSFREAWKHREDLKNTAFLALLASMVGTLVSSIPRKPRLYLAAQRKDSRIPDNLDLVGRCQRICTLARGSGYLENENLSVYDAATSYFLGLSRLYTHNWRLARLYFGECLSIIRTLGLHRDNESTHSVLGKLPESLGFNGFDTEVSQGVPQDNITREMGRRVFWTMFTTVRSMQQLSAEFRELHIPPSTPTEKYPPLPTEIDDVDVYPSHNDHSSGQGLSLMSGFNKNVRVFRSYDWLASMETALGRISVIDWSGQLNILYDALRKCKDCENELPSELIYDGNGTLTDYQDISGDASVATSFAHSSFVRDPSSSFGSMSHGDQEMRADQRRVIQNSIQRGNIHASILSTRAYIVQKFWTLYEAQQQAFPHKAVDPLGNGVIANGFDHLAGHGMSAAPDFMEQEMRQESEFVIKDILSVLGNIKEVNMELNADNFTAKIRALASILLQIPDDQGEQPFQEPLTGFLQSLGRLERNDSIDSGMAYTDDEDSENREWAELQACRMQLAELATSA